MDAYIFQAALLCSDCATAVMNNTPAPEGVDPADPDESLYDSSDWPKGPYSDGGGEADSPQHCDHCTVFLDNPLTGDGEDYVREQWEEYCASGVGNPAVLHEWLTAYEYVWGDFRERLPAEYEETANYLERGDFGEG